MLLQPIRMRIILRQFTKLQKSFRGITSSSFIKKNKFQLNSLNHFNKLSNPLPSINYKNFSNKINDVKSPLNSLTFIQVCDETLDSLCEYFEELVENSKHLKNSDVEYSDGVLTVKFGTSFGTYVINRQTPNLQIWLSSPKSGPKRYDFVLGQGWIYKHDNISLHSLLNKEIAEIVNKEVNFEKCIYGSS